VPKYYNNVIGKKSIIDIEAEMPMSSDMIG